jgi:hypothetical protein
MQSPIRTFVEIKVIIEIMDAQALWDRAVAVIGAEPILNFRGGRNVPTPVSEQEATRRTLIADLGPRERPNVGECCVYCLKFDGLEDDTEMLDTELHRVYDTIDVEREGDGPLAVREFIHERKLVNGREQGDGV